jgi:2-keto-4-pentenoate hydratase/2-oxohepta-3-ene-1,7-dioic acid hydratase in catechol pathway
MIYNIYAAGMTYYSHVKQSGEDVPKIPVFFKKDTNLNVSSSVKIPTNEEIVRVLYHLDFDLPKQVGNPIPLLIDYEIEIALMFNERLMKWEAENWKEYRNISMFVANDLTLRSVQVLGERQKNKLDYWSKSKSFRNFLPISRESIRLDLCATEWPSIYLRTKVNGNYRQHCFVPDDMIFSPRELILAFMEHYGLDVIPEGTFLLTGTPAGCAFRTTKFKKFIAKIIGMSRLTKLKRVAEENQELYLKAGQTVSCDLTYKEQVLKSEFKIVL